MTALPKDIIVIEEALKIETPFELRVQLAKRQQWRLETFGPVECPAFEEEMLLVNRMFLISERHASGIDHTDIQPSDPVVVASAYVNELELLMHLAQQLCIYVNTDDDAQRKEWLRLAHV